MVQTHPQTTLTAITPRKSRLRRSVSRMAVAGGVVISTLALAAPSWAGPMTGC